MTCWYMISKTMCNSLFLSWYCTEKHAHISSSTKKSPAVKTDSVVMVNHRTEDQISLQLELHKYMPCFFPVIFACAVM